MKVCRYLSLITIFLSFIFSNSAFSDENQNGKKYNYHAQLNHSLFQGGKSEWADSGTTSDDYVKIDSSKLDGFTGLSVQFGIKTLTNWEISIRQLFKSDTYWNTGRVEQRDGTDEVRIKALTQVEDTSLKIAKLFDINDSWVAYPFLAVGKSKVKIKGFEYTHTGTAVPISNSETNNSIHYGAGLLRNLKKNLDLIVEIEKSDFGKARLLEFNGTKTVSYEVNQLRLNVGLRYNF